MADRNAISDSEQGWTRISSFKPQVVWGTLTCAISACLLILVREQTNALFLVVSGTIVAIGLIALNCKVIHRRGGEYRVSTLFYSETVRSDDVCMTVKNPGPLWTRLRIHLTKPARFGWMISFVPAVGIVGDREDGAGNRR